LAVPLIVCAVLNAANLLAIARFHPAYLRDERTIEIPDAQHYLLLGRNLLLHGEYSRSQGPPYVSDVFRTPVYPVFAGGFDLLGGPGLIYAVQAFLHVLTVLCVYRLADRTFGERAAFFAALLIAIHPTLLMVNLQAMSETLFVFTLVLSVLVLHSAMTAGGGRWRYFAAGALLGVATMVRPAGLYLPLALAVFALVARARTDGFRRAGGRAAALVLGAAIWIAPWIIRNAVEFGIPKLTTNDTVVLVYFTGAGAYQAHYGIEREAAVQMIADEFHIHTDGDMCNYHSRGYSPAALEREARPVIVPVLTRFPADLCRACSLGLAKALFSHDAQFYAGTLGLPWSRPGAGGLVRLDRDAWGRLLANHPLVIAAFAAPFAVNAVLVPLALVGAVLALKRGGAGAYLILLLFVFFALVCAAVGMDAYTRYSAPILPFAAVLAGLAADALTRRSGAAPVVAAGRDVRPRAELAHAPIN
jgi:4-amino-4-deoxy-L-arabinose transferase-like glycosyltransferase